MVWAYEDIETMSIFLIKEDKHRLKKYKEGLVQ